MAKTLTVHVKGRLDSILGPGGATKMVNLITSGTALDGLTKSCIEKLLGGIGEGAAFMTACINHSALSTAAMNRLEKHLNGRGHAEELNTAVLDGTVS